jgi:lipopolysaccharide exporter
MCRQEKIRNIINTFMNPGGRIEQQLTVGGFWVFAIRGSQQVLNLIRLVVLARILSPSDFGLMGIALLSMATLEALTQTGFRQALIQYKENVDSYLDAAWTMLVIRGFFIFVILFSLAPYVADFFKAPGTRAIVQVIGLSIFIQALTNIGVVYFERDLEFNKQFIYESSGTIADFIVALILALIFKNVWALLFGLLTGNVVRCIVSYMIHPFRPHFNSDFEKIRKLWGFGKWIFSSSILIFLITQGDDIFVGKLLGATMLGFYQIAFRISNMPATEISHVISRIAFPAYSKLQSDLSKVKEMYLKVLQFTLFLTFPIAGSLFVLAPHFTSLFLGEKWMPMVPALQALCFYGIARAFGATAGTLFQGVGKPSILTHLAIIDLTLMILIIYPLTSKYGILGTSLAVLIPSIVTQFVAGFNVLRVIKYDGFKFIKVVISPLISTVVVILPLYVFINFYQCVSFLTFTIVIIYIIGGYLVTSYLTSRIYSKI